MDQLSKTLIFLLSTVIIFLFSCTPKEDEDPNPSNSTNKNVDPDKVTQSIKFKNGTIVSGPLASITKTTDLQLDTDTIFWTKGITKRLRIRKPPLVSIGSLAVAVKGSNSYINVLLQKDEETDSTSVFYFDFDSNSNDWQFPISFEIKIIMRRDDGTPLDESERPVVLEDDKGAICMFKTDRIWKWIATTGTNFQSAPMLPQSVNGTLAGCCDSDGNSFYASCFNTPAHREVNYQTYTVVENEYLKLFASGDVAGELRQTTQNIQPLLTDFCGGAPGYKVTEVYNSYTGSYTLNTSNCTMKLESLEGLTEPVYASDGTKIGDFVLPIYAGFGTTTEYKIISKHFIKETQLQEGGSLIRIYEASPNGLLEWHD